MPSRVVVAALLALTARAAIYQVSYPVSAGYEVGPFTEGPMFAKGDLPLWGSGNPTVGFKGFASLVLDDGEDDAAGTLWVVFSQSESKMSQFPPFVACGEKGANQKHFPLNPDTRDVVYGDAPEFHPVSLQNNDEVQVEAEKIGGLSGYRYVTFVLCSSSTTAVADVSGELIFKNPYGYLPGVTYGFLPFQFLMFVGYVALLSVFLLLFFLNRKTSLFLQKWIVCVICISLLEAIVWWMTYISMNKTGHPSCCPVRKDFAFALYLGSLKKAVMAVLVLSVCLGFGVVKPYLTKRTTLKIAVLGTLYFAFSLNYDVRRVLAVAKGETEDAQKIWTLPTALCEVALIVWIFHSLGETQESLKELKQTAKLAMYNSLSKSIAFWVMCWFVFTIALILISSGAWKIHWRFVFLQFAFEDVAYLGILATIATLWRPTPQSAQYAYSYQIPTNEMLDEFDATAISADDDRGYEMGGGAEEDDDDLDLGLEKNVVVT